jgi:PRTRC genetic system protein B
LTIKEGNELAKALTITEKKPNNFLNPKGLLPKNVLSLKSGSDGFAVWHTPAQRMPLLFIKDLDIPCGKANISALLWKATKNSLQVFAVTDEEINEETPLFYAPFFNTYETGRVCMGNVPICIPKDCGLEMFMQRWDEYFFNSYFSHLFNGHQPVKGNIIQLWKSLVNTKRKFPIKSLIQTKYQLKNLLP